MENSDSDSDFSAREALLVIPLTATALALSWEVGSFIPVGGAAFSYFSIAEHIAFAAPALPFALLIATAVVAGHLLGSATADKILATRVRFMIRPVLFVLCGAAVALGVYRKSAALVTLGVIFLLVGCAILLARSHLKRIGISTGLVSFALLFSVSLGVDYTRDRLNSASPELSSIQMTDGVVSAVVIRSGERGLLYYDPSSKKIVFKKWELVKAIDWPRAPVFRL
jgi:hypothetical protein